MRWRGVERGQAYADLDFLGAMLAGGRQMPKRENENESGWRRRSRQGRSKIEDLPDSRSLRGSGGRGVVRGRGSGKRRQCGETAAARLDSSDWTLVVKKDKNQTRTQSLSCCTMSNIEADGCDNDKRNGITDGEGLGTDSIALVCRIWHHCVCWWVASERSASP